MKADNKPAVKMEKLPKNVFLVGLLGPVFLIFFTYLFDHVFLETDFVVGLGCKVLCDVPVAGVIRRYSEFPELSFFSLSWLLIFFPLLTAFWLVNKPHRLEYGQVRLRHVFAVLLSLAFLASIYGITWFIDPDESSSRRLKSFGAVVSNPLLFYLFMVGPICFFSLLLSTAIKLALLLFKQES